MLPAGHRRRAAVRRRQPVRLVLAERPGDQAEGVFGLPVGQPVRAGLPVREHAEPPLVAFGQADQGVVDPGQVRGPAVGEREHHARQQGADGQLPARAPDGSRASIRGAMPEASMTSSVAASAVMAGRPPAAGPRRLRPRPKAHLRAMVARARSQAEPKRHVS